MNVQFGRIVARKLQTGQAFRRARVVSTMLSHRRLDQQLTGLLAESVGRYAQFGHGFVADAAVRPRYVEWQIAFGHETRDLGRLAGEYRLFEGEWRDTRRY